MQRREFLRLGLTAVLAATPVWAGPRPSVVVLGAGLSGLSTAWILGQAGWQVTVVEARNRLGGRIWTLREPFADGLYAEAGAARVANSHALVQQYCKRFHLVMDPFQPRNLFALMAMRGRVSKDIVSLASELTPAEHKTLADDPEDGMWDEYVYPALEKLGDPMAPDAHALKYDRLSYPDFLRTTGASAEAIRVLTLGYDTSHLSALYMLREMKLAQGQSLKIRGGSERLPLALSRDLKGRILTGTVVQALEQKGSQVVVHCSNATVHADYAVCTLPFSVLRSIDVRPGLSGPKRSAIHAMTYASVTRTYLQTADRFWETQQLSGFAVTDDPLEVWSPAWDQPGPSGILMTYANDVLARRQAAMPVAARVADMQARVAGWFGRAPSVVRSTSVVWDEDPYARGAYCVYQPGQMATILPHVAAPEGRIFFAGEHTSPWCGWMEGALQSAHRVALELQAAVRA